MVYRGALIGCGYISKQQLWAWEQVDEAQIVAVCDIDRDKALKRAAQFNVPAVYTDYRVMLEEQALDFIDIATRPANHLELVLAGATRGLNVLCQKPVAETMEEARQMVTACQRAGVLFMVNENVRHQPWFRQVKLLLDQGFLGTPYDARFFSRWRSTLPAPDFEGQSFFADMPRLIVYEWGVHLLDTARFLFGEAQSLYARLQQVSPYITGEDKALVIANFGHLTCLLDTNWYAISPSESPDVNWGTFAVDGTLGTAILGKDGRLTLHTSEGSQVWEFPSDSIDASFIATQGHFIDCLRTGKEPETGGDATLKTMALVFAAYCSAEEGRVVALDKLGE